MNVKTISRHALAVFTIPGGIIALIIWVLLLLVSSFLLGSRVPGTAQRTITNAIDYIAGFFWLFVALAIFSIK